ncbi:MAG TPA: diguanylate cyclase [Steroidobacteraceae bacterium]|nr:diguanylate cyclase [Steroidobacteraceae bacterium]
MIRMLVLEDDAAAAESSCRMLKHAGIDCSFERVESEVEFRHALGRSPDVILSDSNVRGFDGLSALAIVREQAPGTPFIFVTGNPDDSAAKAARELGAAGFLGKGDLERLAGIVCSVLDARREAARERQPDRRHAETDTDASSTATYLIERQAILDRALRDEDRSVLSNVLRRHPPVPIALLVLASQDIRERFVKWLLNANIEVEPVDSTTEALASLEARTHALLFTDRLDLVQAMRQLHAGSATHVVYVDVDGSVGSREALRRGANDCMPAEAGGEEFWAHLTTARRIASLSAALQLALTDNRILSTIDELTRCGSRRFFEHEFPREVERAVRLRRSLSLIMCDIDFFKKVNDSHGHEVGDEVLREFSARLTHGLRLGEDWVARIGGEEFAIVLPEVAIPKALLVAQRLCDRISQTPYPTAAGQLRVTGSFGISGFAPHRGDQHASPRTLIRAADAALYESKRTGRNRVTVT